MTTPTDSASTDLDNELKVQYIGLTSDLKNYFDDRQNNFLDQSKSQYENPEAYPKDRGEFLISSKIDNLESHRKEVWDFLTNEFTSNTKDTYTYAKMISQNKKQLDTQKKMLKDKVKDYKNLTQNKSTYNRQREIALYEYNRRLDQLVIMKVIGIVLAICLFLSVLIGKEFLPYETVYLILVIFALLIFYIIYYMYLKNPGRSSRKWDKRYFKQPDLDLKTKSIPDDFDYDSFDKKLDADFNRYLDTCRSAAKDLETTPSATPNRTPSA
jgi:hypothetical protein